VDSVSVGRRMGLYKMILVDFSQVIISNLMQSIKQIDKVDEDFLRHMIFNSIRYYKSKFKNKYGEKVVICCDSRHYWRKDVFPHYKASRKKGREDSGLDWNEIFGILNQVKAGMKEHSPYIVLEVDGCEADDIIGVLAKTQHTEGPIMIVSGDKDFKQLQRFKNVSQFSPVMKKMLVEKNPKRYLIEHIMRGDGGDGIPNFLSPADSFVTGTRQKALAKKKVDKWVEQNPTMFCNDFMLHRYKENEKLVDLAFTPDRYRDIILTEYGNGAIGNKGKLLSYFMKNGMRYLIDKIEEF